MASDEPGQPRPCHTLGPGRLRRGLALVVLTTLLLGAGAFLVDQVSGGTAALGESRFAIAAMREASFRGPDGGLSAADVKPIGVDPELGSLVVLDPGEASADVPTTFGDDSSFESGWVSLVDTSSLEQTAVIPLGEAVDGLRGSAVLDPVRHRVIFRLRNLSSLAGDERLDGDGDPLTADGNADLLVGIVSLTGEHPPLARCIPEEYLTPKSIVDTQGEAGTTTVDPSGREVDDNQAGLKYGLVGELEHDPVEDVLYVTTQPVGYQGPIQNLEQGLNISTGAVSPQLPGHVRLHEIDVQALVEAPEPGGLLGAESGFDCSPRLDAATTPTVTVGEQVVNWTAALPQCRAVPINEFTSAAHRAGVMKDRANRDLVHVPCIGAAGESGFVHVDRGGRRGRADATEFARDFTHVPVAFRWVQPYPESGLFVLQALERTQEGLRKLVIFDAGSRTFRAALDSFPHGIPPVIDAARGRLYHFSGDEVRTTDIRPLAIGNGSTSDLGAGVHSVGAKLPVIDPTTGGIILTLPSVCQGSSGCADEESGSPVGAVVLEDTLPVMPLPTDDPDARTEDVDEEPGVTVSEYAGTVQAFGVRTAFLGGVRGSAVGQVAGIFELEGVRSAVPTQVSGLYRSSTRQGEFARVPLLSVTGASDGLGLAASGSAAGLTLDEETAGNLASYTGASLPVREASVEGQSWPEDFPEQLGGHSASCNDLGTEPAGDARPGSSVRCDAASSTAAAAALYPTVRGPTVDELAGPLVRVGDTEVVTAIRRDPERGIVTEATAVARDVELLGGAIRIGEARTTAASHAGGRPGTAATGLSRAFSEVVIGPPGEAPAFRCGFGDDCDPTQVVAAINALFPSKVEAYVPEPDRSLAADPVAYAETGNGSPRGARAAVQRPEIDIVNDEVMLGRTQSELPALVVVVYADGSQASRLEIQFAAVSLDAQYTVTTLPTFDSGPPPPPPPPATTDPGGGLPPVPSPPPSVVAPSARSRQVVPPLPMAPPSPMQDAAPDPAPTASPTVEAGEPPVAEVTGSPSPPAAPAAGSPPVVDFDPTPPTSSADSPAPDDPSTVVAGPGTDQPSPVLADDRRVSRQHPVDGASLAVLAALGMLPGYLALRRGSVRLRAWRG